jgi:NTE family protein
MSYNARASASQKGNTGDFNKNSASAQDDNNARHRQSRRTENVLVIQGGGSLGAFGCGVYKALAKRGIDIDIVSGTSMGAINAAIIAGSKSDSPEKDLEDFWLELAGSSHNIIPDLFFPDYNAQTDDFSLERLSSAGLSAAFFGVPAMFMPRWLFPGPVLQEVGASATGHRYSGLPQSWTYIYDHSPLGKTLDKYVDFAKLGPARQRSTAQHKKKIRLLITAVNVLTSEPIVMDDAKMQIQSKHLLATTGYPLYGFPWVKIDDGTFAWDGSLLDNTPLRQVLQASPRNDKHVYIVENYPRYIDELPSSMMEVLDRTRDIIFSDKTKASMRMSRFITRQIRLIEHLYDVFETADHSKFHSDKIRNIKEEYGKLVHNYGAEILSVNRIIRDRIRTPHILKNADFSPAEIRRLISQGEQKTIECLDSRECQQDM